MSQAGHIVKPGGARKTWSIMYREPSGVQQWEGKFKTRHEAQKRLNEVLGRDRQGCLLPPVVRDVREVCRGLAGRSAPNPRQHGIRLRLDHQPATRAATGFDRRSGTPVRARRRGRERHDRRRALIEDDPQRSDPAAHDPSRQEGARARCDAASRSTIPRWASNFRHSNPARSRRRLRNRSGQLIGDGEGDRRPRLSAGLSRSVYRRAAERSPGASVRRYRVVCATRSTCVTQSRSAAEQMARHKWEWHVGPPKSRKSSRRIAATESVMKMLADLKVGKPDGASSSRATAPASSIRTSSTQRSGSRSPERPRWQARAFMTCDISSRPS